MLLSLQWQYSLRQVYHTLYSELQIAFDREDPFLNLAIYNTTKYHNNPERRIQQRQTQLIGLIRTLVLKRLESSWRAFEATIENLLLKMAVWLERYCTLSVLTCGKPPIQDGGVLFRHIFAKDFKKMGFSKNNPRAARILRDDSPTI